ncbi:MAG TPA: hypothetical protein VL651_08705, partial [Bacteroidia bacterium]|nr:hypothetical protein [Bacteroidia bacterium]
MKNPQLKFRCRLILSLTFSFCCSAALFSQASGWQWARNGVSEGSCEGMSVATDYAGNAYETGFFMSPTLTFGSTVLTKGNPN